MASIKTSKIDLDKTFQMELCSGWVLDINTSTVPTTYTLTHGKKSMSFQSDVTKRLITRDYGIRLALGRRQMDLPKEVLQAFVDNDIFLKFYDVLLN